MGKKLVLACGNTLRGDDGVGWAIAALLEDDPRSRMSRWWLRIN